MVSTAEDSDSSLVSLPSSEVGESEGVMVGESEGVMVGESEGVTVGESVSSCFFLEV